MERPKSKIQSPKSTTREEVVAPAVEAFHPSVRQALECVASAGVPLIHFGQTALWDEPTKAVLVAANLAAGDSIRTVAGIHDTDYFSKLPGPSQAGEPSFAMVARNDGTTRALWAAVGEVSALFGSETPPLVREFIAHGIPIFLLARKDPSGRSAFIDRATEAWGWRGLARLDQCDTVARDVPVTQIEPHLRELVRWALDESLGLLCEPAARRRFREQFLKTLDEQIEAHRHESVTELFKSVLGEIYRLLLGDLPANLRFSATSEHFLFNSTTCEKIRFRPLDLFLCGKTREAAMRAYNEAVAGEGIYTLDELGDGAIPFDLVVPGRGRGTIRLDAARGWVVVDLDEGTGTLGTWLGLADRRDLARMVERRFGPQCSLIGKAVLLPLMLLSEAVMVLNVHGSVYIETATRRFVEKLVGAGINLELFPILRVRYNALDHLGAAKATFRLPPHLAQAFGQEEISSEEFARRWRDAVEGQRRLLAEIKNHASTPCFLYYMAGNDDGQWKDLHLHYQDLRCQLRQEGLRMRELSDQLRQLTARHRQLRDEIAAVERECGRLRREALKPLWAEKQIALEADDFVRADALDRQIAEEEGQRRALRERLSWLRDERLAATRQWRQVRQEILRENQSGVIADLRQDIAAIEERVARERLEQARQAFLTLGLEKVHCRPTAWWFLLLNDDRAWFRQVAAHTEVYFEELASGIAPAQWSVASGQWSAVSGE